MTLRQSLAMATLCLMPIAASAQRADDGVSNKVAVHGSVQADFLFPTEEIENENFSKDFRTNIYAGASVFSKYIDGGIRLEYLKHPLPGYEPDFRGWGLANIYAKGKYRNMELTLGDFYEQFGSGFILRTYEERSLGIDNSLRGARIKLNNIHGLRFTVLGAVQRRYWDWDMHSKIAGADAELSLEELSQSLSNHNIVWTAGASYVFKHEADEEIIVPGTNYRLNLPKNVSAFDLRTHFHRNSWDFLAEYAWKSSDPSYDNNYIYRHGDAVMLSGSYSTKGLSVLLQAKRSENMSYRSVRSSSSTASGFLNNMPAFSYQHTYALAAMYPYATQAADGEWAFQAAASYTFKRKTALGGKYGTKLRANVSYIRGLKYVGKAPSFNGSLFGTDGQKTKFFGVGSLYYSDMNLQVEKKVTNALNINAMYMYQRYNQSIVEGHGEMVNAHIGVVDAKYRFSRRYTLRGEYQYLATKQDRGDWMYGLLELSVAPYLMFTASDMYNNGGTKTHYFMFNITGSYKSNRLMLGYGRTRAGYNCSGGVCRYVPAWRGFQVAYNYSF